MQYPRSIKFKKKIEFKPEAINNIYFDFESYFTMFMILK